MQNDTLLKFFDTRRPGPRYWATYATICAGWIIDFYDFFIIGFLLAVIGPVWHLTYGQSSWILLAGGVGAIVGSLVFGTFADRFGRKPVVVIAAAICALGSGAIALVPDGAWQLLALIRVIVGFGLGGVATVQIALIAELTPTPYRVKLSGFPIMGPSIGIFLAAISTAALIALLGWRGVALLGLLPLLICISYILVMPESPRWLVTKRQGDRARASIAALLGIPVSEIPIEMGSVVKAPRVSLSELYRRPGRFWLVVVLWTCLATCNYGVYLWGPTITAMVTHVTVAEAAKYFVYISIIGLGGRLFFSVIPRYIGRLRSGQLFGYGVGLTFALAAFLHGSFYAGLSVFVVMLAFNAFFNDGGFCSLTPYTAEIFPVRLAARGVGLAQASNGIGKILGPYCLALIAGSSNVMSAQATEAAILPSFLFLAGCGVVVGVCHTFFAPETLGRALALDDAEGKEGAQEFSTGTA